MNHRIQKRVFSFMAGVVLTTIALELVFHPFQKLSECNRDIQKMKAELDAQRKADEAVRKLIKSNHYNKYPDTASREKALADDYKFFKMAAYFDK